MTDTPYHVMTALRVLLRDHRTPIDTPEAEILAKFAGVRLDILRACRGKSAAEIAAMRFD